MGCKFQAKYLLLVPFLYSIVGAILFFHFAPAFTAGDNATTVTFGHPPVQDAFFCFLVVISLLIPIALFFLESKFHAFIYPINVLSVYWYYNTTIDMIAAYMWCEKECGSWGYFISTNPDMFRDLMIAFVILAFTNVLLLIYSTKSLSTVLLDSFARIMPNNIIPSIILMVITGVLYVLHNIVRGGVASGYAIFDASKDSFPFCATVFIGVLVLISRVYNFIPYAYSSLIVVALMTAHNISDFYDYRFYVNSDVALHTFDLLIAIHLSLLLLQALAIMWLVKSSLFAMFFTNRSYPWETLLGAVYLLATVAGLAVAVKYGDPSSAVKYADLSSIGTYIFGIISVLLFMLTKADGAFYASIVPGLIICIGSRVPTLDALVYEKADDHYTTLGYPIIIGTAIALLGQVSAIAHYAFFTLSIKHPPRLYHNISQSFTASEEGGEGEEENEELTESEQLVQDSTAISINEGN